MACCIVAALILSHLLALLRRWAVFWGLVPVGEHDDPDTLMRRVRQFFALPRVRTGLRLAVAAEVAALAVWAGSAHGTHFYRLGDQAIAGLRGQSVVYGEVCGRDGAERSVRLVFDARGRLVSHSVAAVAS